MNYSLFPGSAERFPAHLFSIFFIQFAFYFLNAFDVISILLSNQVYLLIILSNNLKIPFRPAEYRTKSTADPGPERAGKTRTGRLL